MNTMTKGIRYLIFCFLAFFLLSPAFLISHETENLNRVIRALDRVSDKNFTFEERSLLADYGAFESSVIVNSRIANTQEDSGTFIFAVPLYASYAVDTALALIDKFSESSSNITVAFLGGERNELPKEFGGITHKGLRDLLTLADMPERCMLCYFDPTEPSQKFILSHGIRGYAAPLEIIRPLPYLFESRDIPWAFRMRYNAIYKLGLAEGPEVLSIIRDEEIIGFVLSGENSSNGTEGAILPDDLASLLLEYSGSISFPVLTPDIHYSFFSIPGGKVFFVSELMVVLLFQATAGILLLLYLIRSTRHSAILLFHIRLFLRSFWIIVVFLVFMVISIRISGFLYCLLAKAINPSFSANENIAGFMLMALLAAIVFTFSSLVLDSSRFHVRGRFYGYSAVTLIIFGILFAAFLDISYIQVFLWALLFAFLGALLSKPLLVLLSAFLVPLIALGAVLNIFTTDCERFIGFFLAQDRNTITAWKITIQAGLLFLPVFLLIKRSAILAQIAPSNRKKLIPRRKFRRIFFPVLIMLTLGGMVAQIRAQKQQIVPERRFIAEASGLENNGNLTLSLTDIVFQDSRIITLTLTAKGYPVRLDVSAVSGEDKSFLQVYSASIPFERHDEGTRVTFLLGEYPPNPLTIEIVLPRGFEGQLETAAIYNTWDQAVDPGREPDSDDYVLQISKSIDLILHKGYQENSTLIPSFEESTS